MKREEVKANIAGITDEQLNWIMQENGKDINAEKEKAKTLKTDLDSAMQQLATAKEGLKAFDGVNVDELRDRISTLQNELSEQADAFAFDAALDGAIRDANGRDVRAIRGMLDIESLRSSKDRSADIKQALEALAKEKAWAFDAARSTGVTVTTGTEHGTGGGAEEVDGVSAAFQSMNPGLKL